LPSRQKWAWGEVGIIVAILGTIIGVFIHLDNKLGELGKNFGEINKNLGRLEGDVALTKKAIRAIAGENNKIINEILSGKNLPEGVEEFAKGWKGWAETVTVEASGKDWAWSAYVLPRAPEWSMQRKNYWAAGYSELDQINTQNVSRLKVVWTFSTGALRGHEGSPLVVGTTMYVHTPYPNHVYALDLTKKPYAIKWKYTHPSRTSGPLPWHAVTWSTAVWPTPTARSS
jgi:hypothetical protein